MEAIVWDRGRNNLCLQLSEMRRDETRVQVIDEPEQKASTQNWMWVYLIDEYSDVQNGVFVIIIILHSPPFV